ncbi:MAG TPA: OB-fold domain-containing protein, partial [Gemmatimonadaceae bacterium]|nr:OB-fold domain-containing protein [Gemmatimonadaceae bacterium]
MISRIAGKLVAKELDRVEIFTSGGVAYELAIPLGVYETLPRVGEIVELQTHLVVREDAFLL